MFKLVVVAGKLRGREFELSSGDNILGRDDECDVHVPVDGVSKQHLSITVSDDSAYLKDLGSSNGTYLNGKLIKNATIENGDKLALPDIIVQLVHVTEKKVIVKKSINKADDLAEEEDNFSKEPPAPKEPIQKIIWAFRYKLMPHLYGLNKDYEWSLMLSVVMAAFVMVSMYLTIFPALSVGKKQLLVEVLQRGKIYTEWIATANAKALENNKLDQIDTSFIENNNDVEFELFDLNRRVFRPIDRMNDYIRDPWSVEALEWAQQTINKSGDVKYKRLSDGAIGIASKISVRNARTGMTQAVGVIALRFKPQSIVSDATMMIFLEALITAGLCALVFFGVIYFLSLRPLEEIKFQIDEFMRGKIRNIESTHLMKELSPLKNSLNTLFQRYRDLDSSADDIGFDEIEDPTPYVNSMLNFLEGAHGATMILDADKNLLRINTPAEDVTGIRESGSEGMSLLDVARNQGLAATIIELCDNSSNDQGSSQQGSFELEGNDYNIFVNSLIGKDGFSKCFYVTFVRDE